LNSLAEYQKNSWVTETSAVMILRCPQCNADNQCVSFQCQLCASSNVSRGSAVQHDRCGNIDYDYNFVKDDGSMHCKKCNKDLKAIGVDYSRLGSYFKCHKCNVFLPVVDRHYQCFECGRGSTEEELVAVRLPTYAINPNGLSDASNGLDLEMFVKEIESLG